MSKPSDLIPELQGPDSPLRVELKELNSADFLRILLEPRECHYKTIYCFNENRRGYLRIPR